MTTYQRAARGWARDIFDQLSVRYPHMTYDQVWEAMKRMAVSEGWPVTKEGLPESTSSPALVRRHWEALLYTEKRFADEHGLYLHERIGSGFEKCFAGIPAKKEE